MKSSASKIQMTSFQDLFQTGSGTEPDDRTPREIPLSQFQQIVGGPIEAGCYLPQRVMLVCNSEGKHMGLMPNRENPTDSADFIAGTFLLCSFEGEHFASLSPAQRREFEAYFALPDAPEKGDSV